MDVPPAPAPLPRRWNAKRRADEGLLADCSSDFSWPRVFCKKRSEWDFCVRPILPALIFWPATQVWQVRFWLAIFHRFPLQRRPSQHVFAATDARPPAKWQKHRNSQQEGGHGEKQSFHATICLPLQCLHNLTPNRFENMPNQAVILRQNTNTPKRSVPLRTQLKISLIISQNIILQ